MRRSKDLSRHNRYPDRHGHHHASAHGKGSNQRHQNSSQHDEPERINYGLRFTIQPSVLTPHSQQYSELAAMTTVTDSDSEVSMPIRGQEIASPPMERDLREVYRDR